MKILITGGAGFIGSHLTEVLLENGHDVVCLDDLSTGSEKNIESFRDNPQYQFVKGSILDFDLLASLFLDIQMVYHLAAAVGVTYVIDNPLKSIHTNVLGSENVFKLANQFRCKIVLASTSEVYGKNDATRLKEDSDRIIGQTNITRWSYASSKALDEFMAFAYFNETKLPIVIARLFNTCGPRQSARYGMVIPRFIKQALKNEPISVFGTGEQTRAFTYVKDTVKALYLIGFTDACVGQIFNIGNDHNAISILELAQKVKELSGSASEIEFIDYKKAYGEGFEDMLRRVPDVSKLKSFTGFRPLHTLDDILLGTIASMKEGHVLQKI